MKYSQRLSIIFASAVLGLGGGPAFAQTATFTRVVEEGDVTGGQAFVALRQTDSYFDGEGLSFVATLAGTPNLGVFLAALDADLNSTLVRIADSETLLPIDPRMVIGTSHVTPPDAAASMSTFDDASSETVTPPPDVCR